MHQFNQTTAVFLATTWLFACAGLGDNHIGSGDAISEVRDLPEFSRISVAGSMNVYLSRGSDQLVKVEADDNILRYIRTEVDDQTLHIGTRPSFNIRPRSPINIYITLPQIAGISVSGSGDVASEDEFRTDKLDLRVSGSGHIALPVEAKQINSHLSGSGKIILRGNATELACNISGSGTLDARQLTARDVTSSVSGSGSSLVNADRFLHASVSGSGHVWYYGEPDELESNVSGSGSVKEKADVY
ncbi:MAG: DUF2807 domain-containing protein [Candidatus Marinimicrobia bacterium]|nr:DUF2807 domain-containing protein [Candidatus Neomarinimicrobiota bacterium]MCF7840755.1 DUF2807 domain-containing protein [Candidatus Neomarinimicrobiota bacterium]MCF7902697.1 DUF2807 domain-containing protein [Candidatus Neomarinimicrobiota bacterium]